MLAQYLGERSALWSACVTVEYSGVGRSKAVPKSRPGSTSLRYPEGSCLGQFACQAQTVGMDAAGRQQDDGVACAQTISRGKPGLGLDDARATGGQVDTTLFDDAAQGRRFATPPGHAAGVTGAFPSCDEGVGALTVGEPIAAARGPIGLHHQGGGAHGDEVVDCHGDRVLCDGVKVAAARQTQHVISHERLGAQTLNDAGQVEGPHIDDVGRFPARRSQFFNAVARQVRRGLGGRLLGADLDRIDEVILNPRLLVGQTAGLRCMHQRIIDLGLLRHWGLRTRPQPRML